MSAIVPRGQLAHRVVEATFDAWADMFAAVSDSAGAALGLRHEAIGDGRMISAAAVDHMMLNRVVLAPPSVIADAVARFRERNITRFMLSFDVHQLRSGPLPYGLERFHRPWATLACRSVQAQSSYRIPEGIRMRAAEVEDRSAMAALFCGAFDLPAAAAPLFAAPIERTRWQVVVAEDARTGELAGAGMLYLAEGVAVLHGGATAPAFRRRGVQRALVGERVALACRNGAQIIGSETGIAVKGQANSSWNNLERAGLEPVHLTEHLCVKGATWA